MRPEPQGTFVNVEGRSLTASAFFFRVSFMKVPVSENPPPDRLRQLRFEAAFDHRNIAQCKSYRDYIIAEFEQFPEVLQAVAVLSIINTMEKGEPPILRLYENRHQISNGRRASRTDARRPGGEVSDSSGDLRS